MDKSVKIWLLVIFFVTLGLRLLIAFQSPNLNYEAYSVLRQVEHIVDTGTPIFVDDLSYGGRMHIFSPIYHYILAAFSLIMPSIVVLKLLPNIFASLLIFVVYLLAFYLTNDKLSSILAATISGFIPVFFNNTINNASIISLVLPLFFITTYYFLQTNKDPKYLNKLLISMVSLTIVHPMSIVLVISFLVYLVLIKAQHFRESMREPEVVLFFTFLVFWINMMIYKKALLLHGKFIIWQNIPLELIQNSYSQITFLDSIYAIGALPLIFGLTSIYISLFGSKRKTITLMLSICLSIFFLLTFKMIQLNTGLMFLGVVLSILSGYSISRLYSQIIHTRYSKTPTLFLIIFFIILILTFLPNVISSIETTKIGPTQKDLMAFEWLKIRTTSSSVIMALPIEGSALSYYSDRKNVMDKDFLLIKNIDSRYEDATDIYEDRFLTTALERLGYYSVNYIFLSEYTSQRFNISKLAFEGDCVSQVYANNNSLPKIYSVNCKLNQ